MSWEEQPCDYAERATDSYTLESQPARAPTGVRRKESARRRAMFAKAERVLLTAAKLRGRSYIFGAYTLSTNRRGVRSGLLVTLSNSEYLVWTPRRGYYTEEDEPIPF